MITTLHDGTDYRLKATMQRLGDKFDSGALDALRWIQKHANISNALTKKNMEMHKLLNKIAINTLLDVSNHRSQDLHSLEWT